MRQFSFGWHSPGLLHEALRRPIRSISAHFVHTAWRGPSTVTLWRNDGSGLRISSQMHEIHPRLEIGVLNFELTSIPFPSEELAHLGGTSLANLKISKLSITESDVIADSGILLNCKDEVSIVAGAFPYTLAVKGIKFESPASDPEYPWGRYNRMDLRS